MKNITELDYATICGVSDRAKANIGSLDARKILRALPRSGEDSELIPPDVVLNIFLALPTCSAVMNTGVAQPRANQCIQEPMPQLIEQKNKLEKENCRATKMLASVD